MNFTLDINLFNKILNVIECCIRTSIDAILCSGRAGVLPDKDISSPVT